MAQARKDYLEWFRVDRDLTHHPKITALSTLSGWDRARSVGRLLDVWTWVSRHAPEGTLTQWLRDQLDNHMIDLEWMADHEDCDGCRCCSREGCSEEERKRLGQRLAPFFLAGLLEESADGGCIVHDWWAMNGYSIRERNRKREDDLQERSDQGARNLRGRRAESPGSIPSPARATETETETETKTESSRSPEHESCRGSPSTPRARRPRAVPDRVIPDDFKAAQVRRWGLSDETVAVLAERVQLEFDARGYKSARSALLNWCRIEATRRHRTAEAALEAEARDHRQQARDPSPASLQETISQLASSWAMYPEPEPPEKRLALLRAQAERLTLPTSPPPRNPSLPPYPHDSMSGEERLAMLRTQAKLLTADATLQPGEDNGQS